MIRHRPAGSGHAYQASTDQRVPYRPLDGEPVTLGVAAARSVTGVSCEWDDGTGVTTFPLFPVADGAPVVAGAEGHLAAAASGRGGASVRWAAASPPVAAGTPARYRFVATSECRTRRTRWFPVTAARWLPGGGTLRCEGTSRLVDGSVSWLADGSGTHRVRFALRLSDGERAVGFGERYDRLDQRGYALDAVVFEQYKGQGT
ncbi:MAG TPA: hypothetical protein VKB69_01260, partial [Micromonosporaceae bacterium]|nr:hypothetical protein [Micromonosporaceae bacterium]